MGRVGRSGGPAQLMSSRPCTVSPPWKSEGVRENQMKVAVLGLGEAGRIFAEAFVTEGAEVNAYTPRPRNIPEGVNVAPSAADAVSEAELVLSLVRSRIALDVARESAAGLKEGAVYVDLNASSPETKRDISTLLGERVMTVDGALMGSVMEHGAAVLVALSGPGSAQAARQLAVAGTQTQVLEGGVGTASGRKLLRSAFFKGLAALIDETLALGEVSGQLEWLREQMIEGMEGGELLLDRLASGMAMHARRRSAEIEDSLALAREGGGEWPMIEGALKRHLLAADDYEAAQQGEIVGSAAS